MGEIRHFIQSVQQEKEIAAFKQLLAKTFWGFIVRAVKLPLNKGVQALIKILEFPQRQEHRQHFVRKMQGLRAFTQAP